MSDRTANVDLLIRRPLAWVYAVLSNRDLAHAWQWHLYASHQTSPGQPAQGAQGTTTVRKLFIPWTTVWSLERLEPMARVTWRSEGWWGSQRDDFELQAEGKAVRVIAHRTRSAPWPVSHASLQAGLQADLTGLVRMLEEGLVDDPDQAGPMSEHGKRGTLARGAVKFDLRVTPVNDRMVHVELAREHATCQMYCSYCPRTQAKEPRDLPPPDAASQARILEAMRRVAAGWPDVPMALWSDDLLRYPGVFELLDALGDRSLSMHTPGLELADPAFAKGFVDRDVRFDLTVHATDADVWERMCGNREAMELVLRGLDNLVALGIEHTLSIVVTHINAPVLAKTLRDLIARYHPGRIAIRVFYPDSSDLGRAFGSQFAPYGQVTQALQEVAADASGSLPELLLVNLPPCQVVPAQLAGLPIRWAENRNALRTFPFPACNGCVAKEICCGVHPWYAANHPVREPDPDAIAEVLALGAHSDGRRAAPVAAPEVSAPALDGFALDDAGHAWLRLGTLAEGQRAWLTGSAFAAWYELDSAMPEAARARVERRLEAVRERAAKLPPSSLDREAFRRLAEHVRAGAARPSTPDR